MRKYSAENSTFVSGVSTNPIVTVSAVSGFRLGLPPVTTLTVDCGAMLPYCAAVTPLRAHCAAESVGVEPAHGSVRLVCPNTRDVNSSYAFGARTARLMLPRARTRLMGAHSRPI